MSSIDAQLPTAVAAAPLEESARFRRSSKYLEIALLVCFVSLLATPGIRGGWVRLNSDFPNYYTAAKLYREGVPLGRVYEWTWFQREAVRVGVTEQPLVGFVPQPPLNVIPALPLARFSPLTAKRIWIVFNLGLLLLAAWLVREVTSLGLRRSALMTFGCVGPLVSNFRLGQYYVLIVVLLLLAYREFLR